MQLNEFIKMVLVEIAEGINEANKELEGHDSSVNPSGVRPYGDKENDGVFGIVDKADNTVRLAHLIDFDVAVHASEEKEKKGGVGILVASIGMGVQEKTDNNTSSTSRIKFKIPMSFPKGKHLK
jgi:hypothetical protein